MADQREGLKAQNAFFCTEISTLIKNDYLGYLKGFQSQRLSHFTVVMLHNLLKDLPGQTLLIAVEWAELSSASLLIIFCYGFD